MCFSAGNGKVVCGIDKLKSTTGFGGQIHFFAFPKLSSGGELCVSVETGGGHFICAKHE